MKVKTYSVVFYDTSPGWAFNFYPEVSDIIKCLGADLDKRRLDLLLNNQYMIVETAYYTKEGHS